MVIPIMAVALQGTWNWLRVRSANGADARGFTNVSHNSRDAILRKASIETAEARAMADAYAQSDPGFAADLRAAADRHELEVMGIAYPSLMK
jgi:hypothetical protein